jgi:two-component system NtrC family sensor kinase
MTLERRLVRAEQRVVVLERMIELRTRELYFARLAAEAARNYAESIIAAMSNALVVTGARGRIETANPAAAALLGVDTASLVGTAAVRWMGSEAVRTLRRTLADGGAATLETELTTGDGRVVPVLVTVALIPATDGGPQRSVAIAHDLSERKALEVELFAARKFEALGQLSAGVAHELNTPVQFITDNLRFLQERCEELASLIAMMRPAFADDPVEVDGAEVRARIEEVDLDYVLGEIPVAIEQSLDGAGRVAGIVRSMKEFSRASGDTPVPTDVNRVIQNALVVSRSEYKYVADLELELEESLPALPMLADQIGQVVVNLVTNAAHAVEERYAGTDSRGLIRVSSRMVDDGIEISIADNGRGIPERVRDRVFDPFFTTKAVGKGTGQGLPICRTIVVQRHGGQLSFETEIDSGTRFIVTLPRRAA